MKAPAYRLFREEVPAAAGAKGDFEDTGYRLVLVGRKIRLLALRKCRAWDNHEKSPGGFFVEVRENTRPFYLGGSSAGPKFLRIDHLLTRDVDGVCNILAHWGPRDRKRLARAMDMAFRKYRRSSHAASLPWFAGKFLSIEARRSGFRLSRIKLHTEPKSFRLTISVALHCGTILKLCEACWSHKNRLALTGTRTKTPEADLMFLALVELKNQHNERKKSLLTRSCIKHLRDRLTVQAIIGPTRKAA